MHTRIETIRVLNSMSQEFRDFNNVLALFRQELVKYKRESVMYIRKYLGYVEVHASIGCVGDCFRIELESIDKGEGIDEVKAWLDDIRYRSRNYDKVRYKEETESTRDSM